MFKGTYIYYFFYMSSERIRQATQEDMEGSFRASSGTPCSSNSKAIELVTTSKPKPANCSSNRTKTNQKANNSNKTYARLEPKYMKKPTIVVRNSSKRLRTSEQQQQTKLPNTHESTIFIALKRSSILRYKFVEGVELHHLLLSIQLTFRMLPSDLADVFWMPEEPAPSHGCFLDLLVVEFEFVGSVFM